MLCSRNYDTMLRDRIAQETRNRDFARREAGPATWQHTAVATNAGVARYDDEAVVTDEQIRAEAGRHVAEARAMNATYLRAYDERGAVGLATVTRRTLAATDLLI